MRNRTETDVELDLVKAEQELNLSRSRKALARRNFIKSAGLAGAGVAVGMVLEGCGGTPAMRAQTPTPTVSETDVLNFALNLEYLEAEFYSMAVTGATLSSTVTGGTSTAMGGNKVTFTLPRIADIAAEISADETLHVKYLRTALGSSAVAEPVINLSALGSFATQEQFLEIARAFEDTGVSAYAGAATLLTGNNLQAAAQILAVEAYHAGNIRLSVVQNPLPVPVFRTDMQDIPPDEQHFFPTDANGLAIKRTPSQVLAIVYGSATGVAPAGTKGGGFFPNGVNGNINTV